MERSGTDYLGEENIYNKMTGLYLEVTYVERLLNFENSLTLDTTDNFIKSTVKIRNQHLVLSDPDTLLFILRWRFL